MGAIAVIGIMAIIAGVLFGLVTAVIVCANKGDDDFDEPR